MRLCSVGGCSDAVVMHAPSPGKKHVLSNRPNEGAENLNKPEFDSLVGPATGRTVI
jgi:hypothetical protein